jgi:hypothetical protein
MVTYSADAENSRAAECKQLDYLAFSGDADDSRVMCW